MFCIIKPIKPYNIFCRILGSGIKLTNLRKSDEPETEEILAEHRDIHDADFRESNYVKEIKNKVKETVINKIIESVQRRNKPSHSVLNHHRPKWKNSRNDQRFSLNCGSKLGPVKDRSFLPVKMDPICNINSIGESHFEKQHPIIRSNITSAKWHRSSRESLDFPALSSRESKSLSHTKNKKFNSNSGKQIEEKSITLPPIRDCPFQPDSNNTGFFLRSNSCNTHKREHVPRTRLSFRTSSSRIDS